jgi:hypothetical protein
LRFLGWGCDETGFEEGAVKGTRVKEEGDEKQDFANGFL